MHNAVVLTNTIQILIQRPIACCAVGQRARPISSLLLQCVQCVLSSVCVAVFDCDELTCIKLLWLCRKLSCLSSSYGRSQPIPHSSLEEVQRNASYNHGVDMKEVCIILRAVYRDGITPSEHHITTVMMLHWLQEMASWTKKYMPNTNNYIQTNYSCKADYKIINCDHKVLHQWKLMHHSFSCYWFVTNQVKSSQWNTIDLTWLVTATHCPKVNTINVVLCNVFPTYFLFSLFWH